MGSHSVTSVHGNGCPPSRNRESLLGGVPEDKENEDR